MKPMRVYIHDELTDGKVLQHCLKMGVDVLTLAEVRARKSAPKGYDFFLDQVDMLIIEMTQPTQDIHFILAQAIIAKKPTLCLYAKNQPPRELLSHIKMKTAPRPLKTFSYSDANLGEAIDQFVRRHDERFSEAFDQPSIKFTLRLSPRMEEYLTWYADERDVTKADALRELLDRQAKRDTRFRSSAVDE
jgi:hypothetical protein